MKGNQKIAKQHKINVSIERKKQIDNIFTLTYYFGHIRKLWIRRGKEWEMITKTKIYLLVVHVHICQILLINLWN